MRTPTPDENTDTTMTSLAREGSKALARQGEGVHMNTTARQHDISLQLSSYRKASASLKRLLELLLEAPELLLQPDVGNDVLTAICNLQEEARRAGEAAREASEQAEVCAHAPGADYADDARIAPTPRATPDEESHEAPTPSLAPPTQHDLSAGVKVLCADVADALDILEGNLERDLMLESLQRLERVCEEERLGRFDMLDGDVKVHLYGYVVAQCLALQEQSCAGDQPTLRRRVKAIFTAIKAHTPGVFIHGMARDHEPSARTWREDANAHREALEAMLGVCDELPAARRGAATTPEASANPPALTLCAGLAVLARKYPTRLVVLPSAYASAREAEGFEQTQRAVELMERLVTEYLPALERGGDALAREKFTPCEYSATESESARTSKRAMELRTFDYEGEPRQFLRHLRIGTSSSPYHGWRCYFFHDAERSKIVIGHCGKHLDLR